MYITIHSLNCYHIAHLLNHIYTLKFKKSMFACTTVVEHLSFDIIHYITSMHALWEIFNVQVHLSSVLKKLHAHISCVAILIKQLLAIT